MTKPRKLRARFVGGYELLRNWWWRSTRQGERGPILDEEVRS